MLIVSGNHLTKKDQKWVKRYARFVLDRFVTQSVQRRAKIFIKLQDASEIADPVARRDFQKYTAWCQYIGVSDERRSFAVTLNAKLVNKRSSRPLIRLRNVMTDLGHELVHVKQYLNNEIFDYTSGDVRYKGTLYDSAWAENEEAYFDAPWEIEAYGRELGLYRMFCQHAKNYTDL
jgi:hypothetical protein